MAWRGLAGDKEMREMHVQHGIGMSAPLWLTGWHLRATFAHLVTSGTTNTAVPERHILKDSGLGWSVWAGKFFIGNVYWTKHAVTFSVELFVLFVFKQYQNMGGIPCKWHTLNVLGFLIEVTLSASVLLIDLMMNTSHRVWWSISKNI